MLIVNGKLSCLLLLTEACWKCKVVVVAFSVLVIFVFTDLQNIFFYQCMHICKLLFKKMLNTCTKVLLHLNLKNMSHQILYFR